MSGDGTDGAAVVFLRLFLSLSPPVGLALPGGFRLHLAKPLHRARCDERTRRSWRDADPLRESEGGRPGEDDVLAALEDRTREDHRGTDVGDRRDRTAATGLAIHDRSIDLDRAVASQRPSRARVELGIVLEDAHGGDDGIERRATSIDQAPADCSGVTDACAKSIVTIGRDVTGTTVDEDHGVPPELPHTETRR